MGLLDNEYVNKLADVLYNDPKRYWVTEPEAVGMNAYSMAADRYGNNGEWTKADAAKHMAWQGELAKRTMMPAPIAVPVANALGYAKELGMDWFGGGLHSLDPSSSHTIKAQLDTMKNSNMDVRNNWVGAKNLLNAPDVASAAVDLAGTATSSPLNSLLYGLPYARK